MFMPLFFIIAGTAFGWVLSRSGAADYDYIQAMFLFEDFQLYGIIGVGVLVAAPGLLLLRRYTRGPGGAPLTIPSKPVHTGNIVGGLLFGVGWSITGMCPGPVLVNIGEGKLYAIAALVGVLVGAGLFGGLYPKLAPKLGLPPLATGGTGDG